MTDDRHDECNGGTAVVGGRLMQSIPLKSPKLAFVLAFFSGPLGFFYVSWRSGVMSCVAWAVSVLIWIGVNMASMADWPIRLPILVVHESFAPWFTLAYILVQQAVLGGWCAFLTSQRNDAIQGGWTASFQEFKNAKDCLIHTAIVYAWLLIVPWALIDIATGILNIFNAGFGIGVVLLFIPHALISGAGYWAGIGVVWLLTPGKSA